MGSTVTSASLKRERAGADELPAVTQLVLVLHCDRPHLAPARYLLDGLDEVRFGRGDAIAATRRGRTLALAIDDPRMSQDHGRLVRDPATDAWHLDDPRSKNGCVVAGALARTGALADGATLELGHTMFVVHRAAAAPGPADATADELAAPAPELATFDGRFAAQLARLARIAAHDLPVLVSGETGTGKEVVARALHALSKRPGPFVAVNCGALPEALVEAELFGARRGAFSGAVADRIGLVRAADGGTLFLDEIGELRASSQAALLRVLQEREVLPIGETRPIGVDVRFCAATHRDLATMVERGQFRDDLHARLLGFGLELPPLRERRADLGIVIRTLLARTASRAAFTPAAARVLLAYGWPHNIRELERWLASARALAEARPIDVGDLPARTASRPAAAAAAAPAKLDDDAALTATLVGLLAQHGGNVAAVARALRKDRMQIHRWVRRFAIDLETFRK